MFSLSCKDMGQDCPFVAEGATKEEVMQTLGQHAKEVHNMTDADMTPEMMQKADAATKEEV
jgi:predicted small metal-binding protein